MIHILNLTPETWSSFLMSFVEFVCKADESTEFIGKLFFFFVENIAIEIQRENPT